MLAARIDIKRLDFPSGAEVVLTAKLVCSGKTIMPKPDRRVRAGRRDRRRPGLPAALRDADDEGCGPDYQPRKEGLYKWASEPGSVYVGGQKVAVERPRLRRNDKEIRLKSYQAMGDKEPPLESESQPDLPTAGYTYLGQFIDHDLSLDLTPLESATPDVEKMVNARTPLLDLDNLYGGGPGVSPFLYAKGHTDAERFLISDATVEKLGEICQANCDGVLVYRDELLTLLTDLECEEKAAARGFFMTGWTNWVAQGARAYLQKVAAKR